MNKNALLLVFLSVLAGLNVATVRKSEDPIRDGQTSPILYSQKMEEEKDGVKGALLYHVKNNPREGFFIEPPIEAQQKSSPKEKTPSEVAPASKDTAGWWEEQPTSPEPPASPVAEAVPTLSPEPVPREEPVRESKDTAKDAEPAAAPAKSDNVPAGQSGDYWW